MKARLIDNIVTNTYALGRTGFCLDIVHDRRKHEMGAWLYHNKYGIKMFTFGIKTDNLDEMKQLSFVNIDEDIALYIQEYAPELSEN